MSTATFTLIGSIPVDSGAATEAAFDKLFAALDVDDYDSVELCSDGTLDICISGVDVHSDYPKLALDAIAAFVRGHATAGAVFDYGDGATLTFGPTPEARRAARLAYLEDMAATYQQAYADALGRDMSFWQPEVI